MSKWQEDTLYEITMSIKELGLQVKFNKQMEKMRTQSHHTHKTVSERYEYAYNKITKEDNR